MNNLKNSIIMSLKNKQSLVFIALLISVNFFNPFGFIGFTLSKVLFSIVCIYCLVTCKYFNIKEKSMICYSMIIWGMVFSFFICSIYNGQSFVVSFKACSHFLLAYSFLFVLMGFRIEGEKIIHMIRKMCILSMIVYAINFISFPSVIFGMNQDEYDTSRGLVRLGVPCIELIVLLFFYYINQYQIKAKRTYLYLILLCLFFIILSLTRQIIIYSVFLGAILYFKSASWWKKATFILLCSFVFLYLTPKLGLFQAMRDLTLEQLEKNNDGYENIRLIAWRWFTDELQTNEITRIFGNGYPVIDGSSWGNTVIQRSQLMLCFPTDVGWASFYFYYGAITTFFLALVLLQAIFIKKTKDGCYLSYWFIFVILSTFTSGMILYQNQIISITLGLYLVYEDKRKIKFNLINKD